MNKVIRREMLAGDLPAELAGEFAPDDLVSVVVSAAERKPEHAASDPFARFRHLRRETFRDADDVVWQVRSLRDEWD